jgi:nucleoside-diphosphate-sugar epimerase
MAQIKQVLVLGATGGVGSEIAKAFVAKGYAVSALARAKQATLAGISWIQGDALDSAAVLKAAEGCSIIVHAVNPPRYQNWDKLVLPMMDNTIAAAKHCSARIILPGTLYNFGSGTRGPLCESTEQRPSTRKGRIRVELEQRLKQASEEGAKALIVRAGDFFGPHMGGNWFSGAYIKAGKTVRSIQNPASPGIGHAWAYLPDLAQTAVRIMDHEQEIGAFEVFHFSGHWDSDGMTMARSIRDQAGGKEVKIYRMPWTLMKLVAPFSSLVREIIEVEYLWKEEFQLDNTKLLQLLGKEPHTPWPEAVKTSLKGQGCL